MCAQAHAQVHTDTETKVKYTRTCSGDRDRDTGGDRGGHRPRDKDLPPMINATREQFLP